RLQCFLRCRRAFAARLHLAQPHVPAPRPGGWNETHPSRPAANQEMVVRETLLQKVVVKEVHAIADCHLCPALPTSGAGSSRHPCRRDDDRENGLRCSSVLLLPELPERRAGRSWILVPQSIRDLFGHRDLGALPAALTPLFLADVPEVPAHDAQDI